MSYVYLLRYFAHESVGLMSVMDSGVQISMPGNFRWVFVCGLLLSSLCATFLSSAKAEHQGKQDKQNPAVVFKRDHIRIAGSSTVAPYARAVSKAFIKKFGKPDPVIESSGSGGGFREFCKGVGLQFPDITNASRPMNSSEWKLCDDHGVDDITEIYFGNDGLTLIKSRFGEQMNLSKLQLYKATAAKLPIKGKMVNNPYRTWAEIDDNLPDVPIQIFGPTNSHSSYDSFIKQVLPETCLNSLFFFKVKQREMKDPKKFKAFLKENCSKLRFDGAYVGADQTIKQVLKLITANPNALALVGYSAVFNRRGSLQAVSIDGVEPRIYTISDGSYALSRPLYFYIKNDHRELLPDISIFVREFMSEEAMGPFGYLTRMGLGVLSVEQMNEARYAAVIGSKMRRFVD